MTSPNMGRLVPPGRPPTRPRRVLIITCEFPPSRAVAGRVCWQIARYLPRYGWDPVVLTARDRNLEARDVSPDALPVLRVSGLPHPFAIYRRLKARLRPVRVAAANGHASYSGRGGLRRLVVSLGQVPDENSGWILPAVVVGLRAVHRHGIEHLFSSSPYPTSHLVGLVLARLCRLPWTAHFQDPWTHPWNRWREAKPISALSAWLQTALEGMVLRRADAIACVTEQHTNWLRQRYPDVRADKFVTSPNGFDGEEWEHLAGESREVRKDRFVITYAGTLYHGQSPLPLFRALQLLIDSGDVARERIQVDLFGHCDVADGVRVTDMAEAAGLAGCVRISGPVGRAEALARIAHSHLLLLLAERLTLQIPAKTYEYLRAGRPILALAPTSSGPVADLLRTTGGAWVVDAADAPGVTAAIREAYRRWSEGLDGPQPDPEVVASFDRRRLVGRIAELFDSTMAGTRPRPAPTRPVGSVGV